MSCNYADGLSPYSDKGVLGIPEKFDSADIVETKCKLLTEWMLEAKHIVMHTGAGISTSAGIPDFRGPNGVWTLESKGLKPTINMSFDNAIPTCTHMALKKLCEVGYVKYVITQNIDGLHLRSGISRDCIAELHGDMFTEKCNICDKQFIRKTATTSVGQKCLGTSCPGKKTTGRQCRGKLYDTILDWEANLPADDLDMAEYHSNIADLNICLGTTLQIVPSGNLPLHTKKYGGKLVIINLQPTKHDKKADLIINTYVNEAMKNVMKKLGLEIPEYDSNIDPTKSECEVIEWTISKDCIKSAKKLYSERSKASVKKRKVQIFLDTEERSLKPEEKLIKTEIKDEPMNNSETKLNNSEMVKTEIVEKSILNPQILNDAENTEAVIKNEEMECLENNGTEIITDSL